MDEQAYYDALIAKGYKPEVALGMVRTRFPQTGTPSNTQNPADSGSAAPTGPAWTPAAPAAVTATSSGTQVPSYVNINDPLQKAIWDAFQAKGKTPRDQADFDYWVSHASANGGWANEGNRAYWLDRFGQAQGGVGDYEERPETGGTPSGMSADWFNQNAPAQVSPYSTPERQPGMTAPQFQAPTLDDLLSDPGYLAQQQAITTGLEHGAAGKGTLLNGGFLGKVLPRALAENAGASFGNLYQRKLDTFNTQNAATFGTKSLNDTQYQGDVTNALNQYKQRYQAYNDAINNQFRLADLGFSATTAGRP